MAQYEGVNSRLDELQAAFLSIKLSDLDVQNNRRRAIARTYLDRVKNRELHLPEWNGGEGHVFHLFTIRSKQREALVQHLTDRGIGTTIHYPIPPHRQKALKEFSGSSFPVCEQIHREILSIPVSPVLTEEEIETIITALNEFAC